MIIPPLICNIWPFTNPPSLENRCLTIAPILLDVLRQRVGFLLGNFKNLGACQSAGVQSLKINLAYSSQLLGATLVSKHFNVNASGCHIMTRIGIVGTKCFYGLPNKFLFRRLLKTLLHYFVERGYVTKCPTL